VVFCAVFCEVRPLSDGIDASSSINMPSSEDFRFTIESETSTSDIFRGKPEAISSGLRQDESSDKPRNKLVAEEEAEGKARDPSLDEKALSVPFDDSEGAEMGPWSSSESEIIIASEAFLPLS
jgi:hypothetical protein